MKPMITILQGYHPKSHRSAPGKELAFHVAKEAFVDKYTMIQSHSHPGSKGKRHKRVLLLDDDVDLCDVLRSILEWHHFAVTVVHRGVDGVRQIMERDFDAVVCDMVMPSMPGDMFYLAVKKVKPHLCRRFVFITGHADNPKVAAFLSDINARPLSKPIATDDLIARIGWTIAEADEEDCVEEARKAAAVTAASRAKEAIRETQREARRREQQSFWHGS